MLKEKQILDTLDQYKTGDYCTFIHLGHVYSYLIDSRINIFRSEQDEWAVAAERLGYNPRGGAIQLDIIYFGNCLQNLEHYNGQPTNYYPVYPADQESFFNTLDGECLKPNARYWIVRGQELELSQDKNKYAQAGIPLQEFLPGTVSAEEAARLLVIDHSGLFRATDEELYKSIPAHLQKLLVIDEWYHRDYQIMEHTVLTDEQIRTTYEFNKNLQGGEYPLDFESFAAALRKNDLMMQKQHEKEFRRNRPGAYETWRLIAKVIATGDPSLYKPTLAPNSHWRNWPESGSM